MRNKVRNPRQSISEIAPRRGPQQAGRKGRAIGNYGGARSIHLRHLPVQKTGPSDWLSAIQDAGCACL